MTDVDAAMARLRVPRSDVRRIAVFRALMLGDLLAATPALRALRSAYPEAEITFIGLPWSRELVARLDSVDRFAQFPGFPGLPEIEPDLQALPQFLADMQQSRFDLALQLHGSGQFVNALVAAFGARHSAGFFIAGDYCPEPALFTPWRAQGHESERLLALTDHLGVPRHGLQLDFPVQAADREWRAQLSKRVARGRYVCVHPGAQMASRRWPIERFSTVAAALEQRGWTIVVTGSAAEAPLARAMQATLRHEIVDLTGATTLGQLGALVADAALVVANDTGISHIAAAIGTPSVIVSCGADVRRWAPLDRERHKVLAADVACRPCAHRECPTAHECATAVGAARVIGTATDLLPEPHHA
jgi:ADP-heptose:LPS heptosyltransferase